MPWLIVLLRRLMGGGRSAVYGLIYTSAHSANTCVPLYNIYVSPQVRFHMLPSGPQLKHLRESSFIFLCVFSYAHPVFVPRQM